MLSTSPLRRAARWALPALTVIALGACDESPDIARPAEEVTGTQTILGIARNTDAVSTLSTAIGAAGLDGVLVGDGPFTVFAPVDEAFDGLPAGTLDALLESGNADVLAEVLTYHVVPGRFTAADLTGGQTLATAEGRSVTISTSNGVQVNGATVLTADIEASNGVIHLIDGVLTEGMDIADVARTTGETRTLAAAVAAGGLVETLESDGPFTVFAPINSAFDAIDAGELLDPENIDLLQKVLTYHVIPGEVRAADLVDGQMAGTVEGSMLTIDLDGGPKVNGANIIATDIETANGVIHLVDAVLLEHLDVVERAIATPQTETLAAAVGAAGLVETLQGPGPFTVFAPINEAFEALDTGDLLDPANLALLQKVLTYHVIPGEVRAADLVNGQMARTVEGSMVEIDLTRRSTVPASSPPTSWPRTV
jgi:transforming growth factor-beta-induced protein